jgi:hypothetical protein
LTDTGDNTYDDDGDLVTDTGLHLPPQAGFDLDAICHINWTSRQSPFRVSAATAISPRIIEVVFSKELNASQSVPPSYFALDGSQLDGEDSVLRTSDNTIELHLEDPVQFSGPAPILTVSQWIESNTGEHLLDTFGGEVDIPTSVLDDLNVRSGDLSGPLPSYPNPFNGSTTIVFEALQEGHARVSVYDMRGRKVLVLLDREIGSGTHRVVWDGRHADGDICPSGIYFVQLELEGRIYLIKLVHQR